MYFQDHDTEIFDEIKDRMGLANSELVEPEGHFLNGIIRYFKPRKILEIGVAAGASSAIILNAIKDIEDAKLYSIDLSQQYYRTKDKPTGYAVSQFFPELVSLDKWELKTGKLAYEFIDEIGDGIDLCFIDTVHARPGEILDYLMVLPYLSSQCIIVIHDITYHTLLGKPQGAPCGLLFSTVRGTKYSLKTDEGGAFLPNIGAVVCDEINRADSFSVFNLLSLRWDYIIAPEKIKDIRNFFSRHYSDKELYWFDMSYANQSQQEQFKAGQQANEQAQKNERDKSHREIQTRIKELGILQGELQIRIKELDKMQHEFKTRIEELDKHRAKPYSFSQKVKAYALFPWYLYRSIKERRL